MKIKILAGKIPATVEICFGLDSSFLDISIPHAKINSQFAML